MDDRDIDPDTDPDTDRIDLNDGRSLRIRPTRGSDAGRLAVLYGDLPPTDARRRFFSAFVPQLDWCEGWASIGDRGGYGIIAIVSGDEHGDQHGEEVIVGEAGYALRPDGDGDLAVTVATGWRGWLGAYLLDRLVSHAADAGIANLQADVLIENRPMLHLLRRRGAVSLEHPDNTERLTISTTGFVPSWPPNEKRPRVLIEVPGARWSGEQAAIDAGLATAFCSGPSRRHRGGCPVLEGGHCALADDADAILVLLEEDDPASTELIEAHRQRSNVPVMVRANRSEIPHGCTLLSGDVRADVATIAQAIDSADPTDSSDSTD